MYKHCGRHALYRCAKSNLKSGKSDHNMKRATCIGRHCASEGFVSQVRSVRSLEICLVGQADASSSWCRAGICLLLVLIAVCTVSEIAQVAKHFWN